MDIYIYMYIYVNQRPGDAQEQAGQVRDTSTLVQWVIALTKPTLTRDLVMPKSKLGKYEDVYIITELLDTDLSKVKKYKK